MPAPFLSLFPVPCFGWQLLDSSAHLMRIGHVCVHTLVITAISLKTGVQSSSRTLLSKLADTGIYIGLKMKLTQGISTRIEAGIVSRDLIGPSCSGRPRIWVPHFSFASQAEHGRVAAVELREDACSHQADNAPTTTGKILQISITKNFVHLLTNCSSLGRRSFRRQFKLGAI